MRVEVLTKLTVHPAAEAEESYRKESHMRYMYVRRICTEGNIVLLDIARNSGVFHSNVYWIQPSL
jgi:hypothetical protein